MMTIVAQLIRTGNSQAVRIPKTLLEQSGLAKDVELEARKGQIIIRTRKHPRDGWDEAFAATATAEERDTADLRALSNDFDEQEPW